MSIYVHESPEYFDKALKSIWHDQKLKPTEIVLVKDGPVTPELNNVIKKWKKDLKDQLNIISLEKNQGLGAALNEGLKHCNYDVVARMDTDDIAKPNRFHEQIAYLKSNKELSVLGSWGEEFKNEPGDLNRVRTTLTAQNIISKSKYRSPLNHPSVIFRKKAILDVGSYCKMAAFEDYFLWIRLLNNGYKIDNTEEALVYFRVGNDMVGRRVGWRYLKNEAKFYYAIYKIGFINIFMLIFICIIRLPIRLLPKRIVEFIYNNFLRRS
jgi:glycosyltransferase involved in cell wall biosynthesis